MYVDDRYPPRNRTDTALGPVQLTVTDAETTHEFTPNTIIMAIVEGRFDLGEPVGRSFLSGEPGYVWREDNLTVELTREEIICLVGSELSPEAYFKLRDRFGMFFTIHDDFYDEESGLAVQPKGLLERFGTPRAPAGR